MIFVNAAEVEDAIKLFVYNKDNTHTKEKSYLSVEMRFQKFIIDLP